MENEVKDPEDKAGRKKFSLKEFFSLGEVSGYFFRKKDNHRTTNVNIKIMHGINRIAIIVFLAGLIYFIFKRFLES